MTGESKPAVIALDVFGGDAGPETVLKGALRACAPDGALRIDAGRVLLVGDREQVDAGLEALGGDPGFGRLHATETIGMEEKPAVALRAKRDSTISVGTKSVRSGAAGAFVSMGNTGAVVGAGTLMLGTLPGVRRPAIAVTQELVGRPVTILDMGANVSPKAADLLAYGVMGSVLQSHVLDVKQPRIGLLNIGEEPSKGTEVLQEAHKLLTDTSLTFVGNVESGDLFGGEVDVVVADGFTGNVCLKLMEGMAGFMLKLVMGELEAQRVGWGADLLGNLRRRVDYSEYGGALLLGVNGVVVIGHGRSDENAVANALGLAARALDRNVNRDIVAGMREVGSAETESDGVNPQ